MKTIALIETDRSDKKKREAPLWTLLKKASTSERESMRADDLCRDDRCTFSMLKLRCSIKAVRGVPAEFLRFIRPAQSPSAGRKNLLQKCQLTRFTCTLARVRWVSKICSLKNFSEGHNENPYLLARRNRRSSNSHVFGGKQPSLRAGFAPFPPGTAVDSAGRP